MPSLKNLKNLTYSVRVRVPENAVPDEVVGQYIRDALAGSFGYVEVQRDNVTLVYNRDIEDLRKELERGLW